MIDSIRKSDCCGCRLCEDLCPVNCIEMRYDREGFWYPFVDEEKCLKCGLCISKCPAKNRNNIDFEPEVYAAYALDETVCKKSASGGIFQLIATTFVENGGIVYGAAFDEKHCVKHIRVDSEDALPRLFGSKYVQSNTQGIFSGVEKDLSEGKKVLFSGTPCQVAALKSKLSGKKTSELFTIDIICHGVPSPQMWEEYISGVDRNHKVREITFRSKEEKGDWDNYKYKVAYEDGEVERSSYTDFIYGRSFVNALLLRPSCYECNFLGLKSGSDITLGDFWGIEKLYGSFYNDWGVSAVCINTMQGHSLFDSVKALCNVMKASINDLETNNVCFQATKAHDFRMDLLENEQNIVANLDRIPLYLKRSRTKKKITILGSYNLRVVVNEAKEDLIEQYSYSNLKSLLAKPIKDANELFFSDSFLGGMKKKDYLKTFVNSIEEIRDKSDFLVLDFLEERFASTKMNDSCVTDITDMFKEGSANFDYEMRISEWDGLCDEFIEILLKHFDANRIVFCESKLCDYWGMHGRYQKFEKFDLIKDINRYIDYCNKYFIDKSKIKNIVSIPSDMLFTLKYHRYGCLPYHLNYEAYGSMGRQLKDYVR